MPKIITQNTHEIMQNLNQSDQKLNELNQEVVQLVDQYEINQQTPEPSFFNFDNMFFWIVLFGLLLLLIGWVMLIKELKKTKKESPKPEPEKHSSHSHDLSPAPKTVQKPIATKSKEPKKIKVVKVK